MKAETCRLSRETLSFLAASVAFNAALYHFVASAPLLLCNANPISTDAGPSELCVVEPAPTPDVGPPCLAGERKSPFRPTQAAKPKVAKTQEGPKNIGSVKQKEAPLRPVTAQSEEPRPGEEPPTSKSATDLRFVGTILVGAQARGLLLSRDNCSSFSVKPGDAIPEYDCTVSRIEKQSIHLTDSQQQPVVLDDGRRGAALPLRAARQPIP